MRALLFSFRALRRDPTHALVSILGLAIGLGFCLLMLAYARYSWSYDAHVPDVDRVFTIKHRRNWELDKPWSDQIQMAVRDPAKALPGVADVTGYTNWFPLTVDRPDGLKETRSLMALPGFTSLMGIKALQGDLDDTLERPDAVALTEAGARRLFGTTDVLGQTMNLRLNAVDTLSATVRVGAILPTPPANTTIPYELLHGFDLTLLPEWAKDEALTGKRGFQGGYLLLKLAPGASADEVGRALQALADNSPLAAKVPGPIKDHAGKDKFTEVKLVPLGDSYLDDEISLNVFSTDVPRGDPRIVAGVIDRGTAAPPAGRRELREPGGHPRPAPAARDHAAQSAGCESTAIAPAVPRRIVADQPDGHGVGRRSCRAGTACVR